MVDLPLDAAALSSLLAQFLQGGAAINPETLARFYSMHMLLIPGGLFALILFHLYLVVRLGVTSPPWSPVAAGRKRGDEPAPSGYREYRQGLIREHSEEES